jgi:hypothetical protein
MPETYPLVRVVVPAAAARAPSLTPQESPASAGRVVYPSGRRPDAGAALTIEPSGARPQQASAAGRRRSLYSQLWQRR